MKQTLLTICLILFALPSWANEKFSIDGDTIIYDTFKATDETLAEINWEDTNVLAKILSENPNIKTLQLNSLGGIIDAAEYMSDIIIDFELNTRVVGECSSSCAILFIAGEKRTIQRGSWLGFHQGSWDKDSIKEHYEYNKEEYGWTNEFEHSSWIYKDTQKQIFRDMEYLIERGVEPLFAIKTMKADNEDMWYPRRKELEAAGVIRE
tara:strand:- start:59 stop:682 length:624 start_codon:yes stop_codon:yes gene_type:complete